MAVQQRSLPPELLSAKTSVAKHPDVLSSHLFTTSDGDWGIRIHVRSGTSTPIPEFQDLASRFAVVYESGPAIQEARPAYPSAGE